MTAQRGSQLHEFAHQAITLGIPQADVKKTLNMYVNDALGFRMESEQALYYSSNAFGTADTISCRDGILRIHDLKNGRTRVTFVQLMVYAALFCLEYHHRPSDLQIIMRIYQNDQMYEEVAEAIDIMHIMEQIKRHDRWINARRAERFA